MKSLSHVRLFATPWTVAYQAPLFMGFSRQGNWSGVPLQSWYISSNRGVQAFHYNPGSSGYGLAKDLTQVLNHVKACSPTTHDQRLFTVTSGQRTRTGRHPCPIPRWRANIKATFSCFEQSLAKAIGPVFLLPATSSFPHQPQPHFLNLLLALASAFAPQEKVDRLGVREKQPSRW